VLDQGGTIYSFENDPNVEVAKVFLDIEDRVSKWNSPGGNEQGLLGLAMHPKFQDNGQFFVCYTRPKTHESVISRFKVSASDKLKADPNSEEVLMVVPQPYQNHNGGASLATMDIFTSPLEMEVLAMTRRPTDRTVRSY
jgi:hypothetical protein